MAHAVALGFQVLAVVFLGCDLDGHALDNLQVEAIQPIYLLGVVCEQADAAATQVAQDLRAAPVFAHVGIEAQGEVGVHGVHPLLLQCVSLQLVHQADAAAFLAHIQQHAAAFRLDLLHRTMQLVAAIAAAASEDVAGQAFAVHAHQHVLAVADFALHQSHMLFTRDVVHETMDLELAIRRRQLGGCHLFHVVVVFAAIILQLSDGNHGHAPFGSLLQQLGGTHHGAVLAHDLAA